MRKIILFYISIILFSTKLFADIPFSSYKCGKYNRTKFSLEKFHKEPLGILRIVRNQIFASYGKSFKDHQLQEYFNKKTWYKINPQYNDSLLTDIDKYNISLILKIEKEIKSKFAESKKIQTSRNKIKAHGLNISNQLKIIDYYEHDLDNDKIKEILLLTIPWAVLNINGHIDPGEYTSIIVYKLNDKWEELSIEFTDLVDAKKPKYFCGEPIDGILTSFEGSKYLKFADKNKNQFPELYFRESALASTPGYTNIIEFSNGKLVQLFRKELKISQFVDIDIDGIDEIIFDQYHGLYGKVIELYPYEKKVYRYTNGVFEYSKNMSIKFVESSFQESYKKFENEQNLEMYLHLLRHLLQLARLGHKNASSQAMEIINKYHNKFLGQDIKFGKIPAKQVLINDFIYKISN